MKYFLIPFKGKRWCHTWTAKNKEIKLTCIRDTQSKSAQYVLLPQKLFKYIKWCYTNFHLLSLLLPQGMHSEQSIIFFNAAEETTLSCFDFQLSDNLLHLGSKPHTLDTHFSSEALDVQSWARKPKCSTTEPALSQQGPDPESQNPRNLIRVSH